MSCYKLALLQMKMSDDREENFAKAESMAREAAAAGAKVICLPELFLSPYFCKIEDPDRFDLAEEIPGEGSERVSRLAKELNVVIISSLFEKRARGLYHNTCLTFDSDGAMPGVYRKMHIPDDPGYYEKFYFTPGDTGYKAVDTSAGKIGTLVCWDQWYPEAARLTALEGADIICYPTAIGWLPSDAEGLGKDQHQAWQAVQRGHAVANGVYIAACNRVGFEAEPSLKGGEGIYFWGQSFVIDPFGRVVAVASKDAEEILYAEIDSEIIEQTRRWWPFLRDRRIDSYSGIVNRHNLGCF